MIFLISMLYLENFKGFLWFAYFYIKTMIICLKYVYFFD